MSSWPLSQDYNEAIQSAAACFSDPELRQGEPVTNALGLPMPCSGNFADVYAVNCASTNSKWAVKCFTRPVAGRGERDDERRQQPDAHHRRHARCGERGYVYLGLHGEERLWHRPADLHPDGLVTDIRLLR